MENDSVSDPSARLISRAKGSKKPVEVEEVRLLSPEENRLLKIQESLNVRSQLNKLLQDNNERIASERRAELNKTKP